jgi:acetyl-CoA acyltransferase 2
MSVKRVFIVAAKRTPFGTFGKSLKDLTCTQLASHACKAALAAGDIDPQLIDSVTIGNVQQTSGDSIYLARHAGLHAGVSEATPCLTVNRLCGSGFEAVTTAASNILLGNAEVALCGGSESMSQAPFALRTMRWGTQLGRDEKAVDTLWEGLTDQYVGCPMAITAENLAEQYDITKEHCDEFALRSQQTWAAANAANIFDSEIAPMELKGRRGKTVIFDTDEHPRPGTSLESLQGLKPLFKKDGTVSAGNASGISDGAGALVVASEQAVNKHGFTPLAEVVAWNAIGVDPTRMGIGPVPAIRAVLEKANMSLDEIDRVEINEAFAAQYLACEKELGLDRDKSNIHGGAIALGHPTGASGSRILGHLAHEIKNSNGNVQHAIGSACIGGGQGIAVLLRAV